MLLQPVKQSLWRGGTDFSLCHVHYVTCPAGARQWHRLKSAPLPLPITSIHLKLSAMTSGTMSNAADERLLIRAACVEDAAAIAALAQQLLRHEKSLHEAMGSLMPWAASPTELRKQMLRPNNLFIVAVKGEEIVGYIKVTLHGRSPTRRELGLRRWLIDVTERAARRAVNFALRRPRPNVDAVGGYIAGIYVRPDARRASVGRALVTAAEDWLRAQGAPAGELHVLYVNEAARLFWQKLGYEPLTLGMRKKFEI